MSSILKGLQNINEGAYQDGVNDGIQGRSNPRASSIYGPETGEYDRGYRDGLKKGEEEKAARVQAYKDSLAPYENVPTAELEQMLVDIQKRSDERQAIYNKLRGAAYSFDPKRHLPANHQELAAQNKEDNAAWNAIHQVLGQRRRQGVEETKEQDYGPEYQQIVKRVGQMAKEGPRKTVWDPVKRVYKTVPAKQSAIKQGVAEGKMAELEMDLEDSEISDSQFEKMYGMTRKEAREQFSQTDMWAFPEIRDPNRPLHEKGVAEGATVTRIDSKPITDFASNLKAYKHTDDWSQSGIDTGDDSYWTKKKLKVNTTKGLFAGEPHRTALYATGNAHETRYVEFTQDGQPIVYFDKKDLPAMRSRKTYLTVFDASNFRQLPTGEWFSENPGKPIKQTEIGDPFKYIADQGWIVRITDDLNKVFKQVKKMHRAGKISHYGAEGMNESKQGVAEGFPQPGESSGKAKQFNPNAKVQTREMTLDQILNSVKGIPYVNNVVDDWDAKDYSWGVTKKVIEYAQYLQKNPQSVANLPPLVVIDGQLNDGAHRLSAINLLQKRMDPKNPLWKQVKLKVNFGTSADVASEQGVAEVSDDKEYRNWGEYEYELQQKAGKALEYLNEIDPSLFTRYGDEFLMNLAGKISSEFPTASVMQVAGGIVRHLKHNVDEGQIYMGGNKPAGMRWYKPRSVPNQHELNKESAIMKGLQLEGNDEEHHTGGGLGTPYPSTYEQETLPYRTKGQQRTQSIAFEDKDE